MLGKKSRIVLSGEKSMRSIRGTTKWVRSRNSSVVDLEEAEASEAPKGNRAGRPKGPKASKTDLLRGANAVALQSALKVMIADKGVASERKHKDREDQMKSFMDYQARKLELDENKTQAAAIEAELNFQLKQKEAKLKLKEIELNAQARPKRLSSKEGKLSSMP